MLFNWLTAPVTRYSVHATSTLTVRVAADMSELTGWKIKWRFYRYCVEFQAGLPFLACYEAGHPWCFHPPPPLSHPSTLPDSETLDSVWFYVLWLIWLETWNPFRTQYERTQEYQGDGFQCKWIRKVELECSLVEGDLHWWLSQCKGVVH